MLDPSVIAGSQDRDCAAALELVAAEADLLDGERWDEWLDLLHEDMRYWVPLDPESASADASPSLFDDDKVILDMRCRRFKHVRAFGRETGRKTLHHIGAMRSRREGESIVVNSQVVVYEFSHDRLTTFPGHQVHEIVGDGSGLKIRSKTVRLITMTGVFDPIEVIL